MLFLQWLYGNRKREALHEENKKGKEEEEDREAKDGLQMAWFIFYWKKNPLQTENRARVQLSFACLQKSSMPSSK